MAKLKEYIERKGLKPGDLLFPNRKGGPRDSQALGEDFVKMNARSEIRDHLLVRRMKYWLQIARYPRINTQVPTWRARKNFRALQRKHEALAAAHGLTATSVF
jgi:hypothetical protein